MAFTIISVRASASAENSYATPGSRESREYRKQYPELAEELYRMQHRQLHEGWDHDLSEFPANAKGLATRESSANALNAFAKNIP